MDNSRIKTDDTSYMSTVLEPVLSSMYKGRKELHGLYEAKLWSKNMITLTSD